MSPSVRPLQPPLKIEYAENELIADVFAGAVGGCERNDVLACRDTRGDFISEASVTGSKLNHGRRLPAGVVSESVSVSFSSTRVNVHECPP